MVAQEAEETCFLLVVDLQTYISGKPKHLSINWVYQRIELVYFWLVGEIEIVFHHEFEVLWLIRSYWRKYECRRLKIVNGFS